MPAPREIRVFLASPGDLRVERRAFKDAVDLLNLGFGDGANVCFIPLGWEDTLASTGRRSQAVINEEIDRCDVFSLAMHRRWGQPAYDAKPYSSYTEEEFHRALDRFKKSKKPKSPEIFVFFKHVDPASMDDAGPQLAKVLEFRRQLEATRMVLYRFFEDDTGFRKEIDRHLRAVAKGEILEIDAEAESVVLPLEYVERVAQAETQAKSRAEEADAAHRFADAETARAEHVSLKLAIAAAELAAAGRIETAREHFASLIEGARNIEIFRLAFEFYSNTGDLKPAEEIMGRWIAHHADNSESTELGEAYLNLGRIAAHRGQLSEAELFFNDARSIFEKNGDERWLIKVHHRLGGICRRRGQRDQARKHLERTKALRQGLTDGGDFALGQFDEARIYSQLGRLEDAKRLASEALAINQWKGLLRESAVQLLFLV